MAKAPEKPAAVAAPGLSSQQARTALQFLQRTQLQGVEMPAYVDVFNALTAIASGGASAAVPTIQEDLAT